MTGKESEEETMTTVIGSDPFMGKFAETLAFIRDQPQINVRVQQ